jgi:endonuclease/exonuclease/phosphatase family metal-dependent hydrolase
VLVGDLNDHREPAVVDALAGDRLHDAWSAAPDRSRNGLTNPTFAPHQRLDHVLTPNEWTVSRVEVPEPTVVWSRRSDHLPVIATVQMRSK